MIAVLNFSRTLVRYLVIFSIIASSSSKNLNTIIPLSMSSLVSAALFAECIVLRTSLMMLSAACAVLSSFMLRENIFSLPSLTTSLISAELSLGNVLTISSVLNFKFTCFIFLFV